MEDSTSIMDLPNKGSDAPVVGGGTSQYEEPALGQDSGTIDPKYMNYIISGIQQSGGSTLGSLPSRDIPMNTVEIQTDKQMQANYIPAPTVSNDYIKEYNEKRGGGGGAAKNAQKKRAPAEDDLMDKLYIPFIAGLLYLIFNMPMFIHLSFKYFRFLHTTDGNINNIGLILKSISFGTLIYLISR
jgi:hypothetical protein